MNTLSALLRRRRRSGTSSYTPVATSFAFIDGAPTLTSFGATAPLRAAVLDQRGVPMANQAPYSIAYSSGTPANVTVNSSTGLCTAVANGTSVITASATGYTSLTRTATVSQQVASITGVSSTLSTDDASSGTFTPVGKDSNNNTVSGATFSYASSAPSVITVNPSTGAWAGQSAGSATITITSGGVTFNVAVTVTHAVGLVITQSPNSPVVGDAITYTATYNGTDVTSSTAFITSDPTVVTVDPPTLTGAPSPASITQGTGPITVTFPGTNLRSTQTLGGLPTGVTASGATVVDATHISFELTATGSATTGAAAVYLVDSSHGNSGTQTLTVTSNTPAGTAASVRYLRVTAAASHPAGPLSAVLPTATHAGTLGWKTLGPTSGSSSSSTSVQTTGGAVTQTAELSGFVSDALSAQTIASGTWTFKHGLYAESGTAYKTALSLYVWRPGTGVVGYIYDSATGIGSVCTSVSTTAGKVTTFAGGAVTSASGDLLVLEWYAVGPANDFVHYQYDGTATITEGSDTASGACKSELDFPAFIYFGG